MPTLRARRPLSFAASFHCGGSLLLWAALAVFAAHPVAAVERPVVGVSLPPLAWIVERLAGDAVELVVMLPGNSEVETYEPTPQQMRALSSCGLYVEVGHPLFALEAAFIEPYLARHPQVIAVRLVTAAGEQGQGDPHAWMSLRLLRRLVPELARALARLLPAEEASVARRARDLDLELAGLDRELGERLSRAAAGKGRRFLIHHPALGFFAADYGLEQVALEHEGKDPSPRQLAQTLAAARTGGARVVLTTRGTPARAAEVVARELGGRTREVDPLARDWPAALRDLAAALEEALYR